MGPCASYSRATTDRPALLLRTTPRKTQPPPASGTVTASARASAERGSVVTRYSGLPSAHGGEAGQLLAGLHDPVGAHVVVSHGEERVRAIAGEDGVVARQGAPDVLDDRVVGDVDLDPALTHRLTVAGEQRHRHLHRRVGPRPPGPSGLERVAAAAGALGVRVLDREAGAVEAVDVVDLDPADVLDAHGVDVHLHALRLGDLVAVLLGVFPAQLVAEAGAPAAHDSEPEAPIR